MLSDHSQINKTSGPLWVDLGGNSPRLGNAAIPRGRGDSLTPMKAFRSKILDDTMIIGILTKWWLSRLQNLMIMMNNEWWSDEWQSLMNDWWSDEWLTMWWWLMIIDCMMTDIDDWWWLMMTDDDDDDDYLCLSTRNSLRSSRHRHRALRIVLEHPRFSVAEAESHRVAALASSGHQTRVSTAWFIAGIKGKMMFLRVIRLCQNWIENLVIVKAVTTARCFVDSL